MPVRNRRLGALAVAVGVCTLAACVAQDPGSSPPPSGSPSSSSAAPAPAAALPPATTVAVPAKAGALAIGTAKYPLPVGTIVVAPNGNDSAAGTVAAPMRTLGAAATRARANATIALRAGRYHESVTVKSNKRLTIQNYPGEAAWLDGSSPVTGWRAAGTRWIRDNWTSTLAASNGSGRSGDPAFDYVDPAYPMAAHPDQVWIDDVALAQVATLAQVGPGAFYVDSAHHQLVVGTNPIGHAAFASDLGVALRTSAPGSTVRGIGVRRYGTSIGDLGAIRMSGRTATVENVAVTDVAATGLVVAGARSVVRAVTLERNGLIGMIGNYADGLRITSALVQDNNTEHFKLAPVAGGIKVTRTRGVTVTDTVSRHNRGTGLWFDESTYDMTAVRNLLDANTGHGLVVEISAKAVIADNLVTGNAKDAFKINDATGIALWNNTAYGSQRTIELVQDTRRAANLSAPGHDTRQHLPDPSVPWRLDNVVVANNILGAARNGDYNVYVRDYSGERGAEQMRLTLDANRMSLVYPGAEWVWGRASGDPQIFSTVTQFTEVTGGGKHNGETTDPNGSPVGETKAVAPLALPADVAAVIGQKAGTQHVGAF